MNKPIAQTQQFTPQRLGALTKSYRLKETAPIHSDFQLSHTQDLTIQVPEKNLQFTSGWSNSSSQQISACLGTASKALFGFSIIMAMIDGLIWLPLLSLVFMAYGMGSSRNTRKRYELTFSQSSRGNLLSLTEIYKAGTRKLFQTPLTQIAVDYNLGPHYRISFQTRGTCSNIHIKGSYQEIHWIYDELDTWSSTPIFHR